MSNMIRKFRGYPIIICLLLLQKQYYADSKNVIEFQYFGNCKANNDGLPYSLHNTTFGMITNDESEFNTTLSIERDFAKVPAKLKIYECRTMNEAECELLVVMQDRDHCIRMHEKGQFYSLFADAAHPPITCPLKKGIHRIIQARVSKDALKRLPIKDNMVYKLEFTFESEGKQIGCWKVKVKKHRLRNRKNSHKSS